MAIDFGASALGLVANMPSGPDVISDDLIMKIATSVPPAVST
jgi:phosphoribosylanthranilate isomerase